MSGEPEMCFNQVSSGLTRKNWTRQSGLSWTNTCLYRTLVNYDLKMFYNSLPCLFQNQLVQCY
jgi:hypothetical protein